MQFTLPSLTYETLFLFVPILWREDGFEVVVRYRYLQKL